MTACDHREAEGAPAAPSPGPGVAARVPEDLRRTGWFFITSLVVGIGAIFTQTGWSGRAAPALMWMLACLTSGAAVGFLFGIPKILQGDDAPGATRGDGLGEIAALLDEYERGADTSLRRLAGETRALLETQREPSTPAA